ncbi:hypothetical protein Droror1_Dr00019932 [Drosera rotundifolia]
MFGGVRVGGIVSVSGWYGAEVFEGVSFGVAVLLPVLFWLPSFLDLWLGIRGCGRGVGFWRWILVEFVEIGIVLEAAETKSCVVLVMGRLDRVRAGGGSMEFVGLVLGMLKDGLSWVVAGVCRVEIKLLLWDCGV